MSVIDNKLRIFVDTNILISAILSGNSMSSKVLRTIINKYELVICSYTIAEAQSVIKRKFPRFINYWDQFLSSLEFEMIYTPMEFSTYQVPYIRDPKDLPILVSIVLAEPDIVITGDLDFHTSELKERFSIMTPSDFLEAFGDEYLQ